MNWTNEWFNQSNQSVREWINQSKRINQVINQWVNSWMNPWINQSINQTMKWRWTERGPLWPTFVFPKAQPCMFSFSSSRAQFSLVMGILLLPYRPSTWYLKHCRQWNPRTSLDKGWSQDFKNNKNSTNEKHCCCCFCYHFYCRSSSNKNCWLVLQWPNTQQFLAQSSHTHV